MKRELEYKQETVDVKLKDGKVEKITRLKFKTDDGEFYYYSSENAWTTLRIFNAEYQRFAKFLRNNYPKQIFCIILDNAPTHIIVSKKKT